VIDDETMTFENAQELELALSMRADDLTQEDVKSIMADGGMFDATGQVSADGFSQAESHYVGSNLFAEGTDVGAGAAAVKVPKTPKVPKVPKPEDPDPNAAVDAAKQLTKETSLDKAKKIMKDLSQKVGAGATVILDLGRAGVSPHLVDQIQAVLNAMKTQHDFLHKEILLNITNPVDHYKDMCERASAQMTWYSGNCQSSKVKVKG